MCTTGLYDIVIHCHYSLEPAVLFIGVLMGAYVIYMECLMQVYNHYWTNIGRVLMRYRSIYVNDIPIGLPYNYLSQSIWYSSNDRLMSD